MKTDQPCKLLVQRSRTYRVPHSNLKNLTLRHALASLARPHASLHRPCPRNPFRSPHAPSLLSSQLKIPLFLSSHGFSPPSPLPMPSSFLPRLLLLLLLSSLPLPFSESLFPNRCGERCGHLPIPFPFHLNSSCGPPIDSFRLSCSANATSSALFLTLGYTDLRVIDFLPSGSLLLDYSPNSSSSSSSSCDPWYSNVDRSSSVFDRSPFFAVTADNVFRLYACEDSSVCKTGCDGIGVGGGCDGNRSYWGCCYPLSDGSVWKPGDGFSVFSEFGCRGFSSWVVNRSSSGENAVAERGIELEWAVPRRYNEGRVCAEEAAVVNSTAVRDGVRCACGGGFVGDGFAEGVGCFKCEKSFTPSSPRKAFKYNQA